MPIKKLILALMVALCGLPPSQALTLDEARSMAAEHYPLVRDYGLLDLTEQYTLSNIAKSWLPQASLGLQGTWQTSVASYPEALSSLMEMQGLQIKGMSRWQYQATVDVKQTVWDGGRTSAANAITRADAEEQRRSDDVELYKLRAQIDDLYFGILLLEQQRSAVEAGIVLLESNLDRVNALVENGAAMQSNADAVEVELLTNRQQLISIDSSISSCRALLGLYIGSSGNEPLTLPDEIALPATDAPDLHPEMKLFEARIASLDARMQQIKSSLMPTVGAFARGSWGYPGMDFMSAMMTHAPKFDAMLGVSASWNFGEFYTKDNRSRLIDISRQRIEVAKEVFRFNIDLLTTRQRHEIERLRRIATSDQQIVELRQRVREASEAQLQEGIVEPTDLLLHITEEKNARLAANSHHIQYLQALYSLTTTLNQ